MKNVTPVSAALLVVVVGLAAPGGVKGQPGPQAYGQYAFYGEEPWGGSYLGVDTHDITPDRVGPLHLKDEAGVEVTMVDQDAPAGKAGVHEHDVILSVNDQKVESVEQLRRMIHEIPAGRTVTIGISRDGQPMTVKAQLAERNKMPDFNFTPAMNIHIPPINMQDIDVPNIVVIHSPRSSGLMIENLTPQLGDYFGVKGGNGVLVRSVEKGSRGEQAGFRAGDVIVKINGSTVNDCSDFSRLLKARNSNKASVTVVREHREQILSLPLPEPKRTGSIKDDKLCEYLDADSCEQILNDASEVAALGPQIEAQMKRMQPEFEKMKKEFQQDVVNHRDELKKEMEKAHKEMERQREEWKKLVHHWEKQLEI